MKKPKPKVPGTRNTENIKASEKPLPGPLEYYFRFALWKRFLELKTQNPQKSPKSAFREGVLGTHLRPWPSGPVATPALFCLGQKRSSALPVVQGKPPLSMAYPGVSIPFIRHEHRYTSLQQKKREGFQCTDHSGMVILPYILGTRSLKEPSCCSKPLLNL
jgi:hypothetical protein